MRNHVTVVLWFMSFFVSVECYADNKQHVNGIVEQYFKMHTQYSDGWWLRRVNNDNPLPIISMTENYRSIIQNDLRRFAPVSPLAGSISKLFSTQHISVFYRGVSVAFFAGDGVPQISLGSQEICFIPQDESDAQPSVLYYRPDWGALMISAIGYPPKVFAALVFHELGHAKRHKIDKANSAFEKGGTDVWIEEEVAMHELEADILNAASEGKFYAYIDNLVQGASSFQEAIYQLRLKDLVKLDEIIGCSECGIKVSNLMMAQYFMSIGMRHFKQEKVVNERQKRIELYRFIDFF